MTIDSHHYNVAVLGITGVGKSALVNYLFGKKVAKTGLGKPETQRGFHSYKFRIDNLPVKLFDSWGLEVNKFDEWKTSLDEELSRRGTDRPAEDWFHTILYCISAPGSRIHDEESEIIKDLLKKKYRVVVILTKADSLGEEEEAELAKVIRGDTYEDLPVVAVCSESGKDRRGGTIHTFGKEEIEAQIYDNFWNSIISRLPERCRRVIEKYLDEWKNEQIKQIKERDKAGDNPEVIQENLINSWKPEEIDRLIREEISRTMDVYGQISETMEYNSGNQRLRFDSLPFDDRKGSAFFRGVSSVLIPMSAAVMVGYGSSLPIVASVSGSAFTLAVPATAVVQTGASLGSAVTGVSIGTALAPIAIVLPIVALSVGIWRQRVRHHKAKAVESLIKTVETEIDRLKKELDQLEKGIEESLKNLRTYAP